MKYYLALEGEINSQDFQQIMRLDISQKALLEFREKKK